MTSGIERIIVMLLGWQPIIYSSWYSLSSLIFIIHKLCDFKHRCNFEAFYICGIYRSRAMGLMHSDRSISRKYARVRRTKENGGLFLPRESGNADPCRYSGRGLNKHWPVNATVNTIYSQPWKSTPIVFCETRKTHFVTKLFILAYQCNYYQYIFELEKLKHLTGKYLGIELLYIRNYKNL